MKSRNRLFGGNPAKWVALAIFLFSFTHKSYAQEFLNLEPLLGSEWAQQHPGQLPYSKCSLVETGYDIGKVPLTKRGTWETPTIDLDRAALIVGKISDKYRKEYYFSCVSQKHHLAFMLPIKLESIVHFPEIGFSATLNHLHFNKKSLSQMKVASLLKRFVGIGLHASLFVGAGGYGYINGDGLLSRVTTGGMSLPACASAGLSTLKLKKVRNDKLPKRLMTHQGAFLLTKETARSLEEPIVVCDDNKCGIKIAELSFSRNVFRTMKNAEGEDEYVEVNTQIVIPAGTLAVWNGKGFEIEYHLKGDSGEKQVKETFPIVTALDSSVVNEVINGRVFLGYNKSSVILHRTNGSIIGGSNDAVGPEEIKNMKFVWDERQDECSDECGYQKIAD